MKRSVLKNAVFIPAWIFFMAAVCLYFAGTAESQGVLDQKHEGDFLFTLNRIELVDWPGADSENGRALALTVTLKNVSTQRKIELSRDCAFQLSDEFANGYRILSRVMADPPALVIDQRQPFSLYPQARIIQIIYFEMPVRTSQSLELRIDASPLGLKEPIVLSLPRARIVNDVWTPAKRVPRQEDFFIQFPPDGGLVRPGEVVKLQVKWPEDIPAPRILYVLSPTYTLEDSAAHGQYYIRIPKGEFPKTFPIVVVGRWGTEGDDAVISQSVALSVMDPSAECLENCLGLEGAPPGKK